MRRLIWGVSDGRTQDAFLGGRVTVAQPKGGYRSGVDAVLLAAAVPAVSGQTVLELGCGAGAAALCLAARVPGLSLTGVELQADYAAIATENAAANRADFAVTVADLRDLPGQLRNRQWHHVMMNPPYFRREAGSTAPDAGRETAMSGDTPMVDWLDCAARRLAPKGTLTLIQHIARLPEMIAALPPIIGAVVVLPIVARAGQMPSRFILQGAHSRRTPFRMMSPLVLHDGAAHDGDRESYTSQASQILRNGAFLDLSA